MGALMPDKKDISDAFGFVTDEDRQRWAKSGSQDGRASRTVERMARNAVAGRQVPRRTLKEKQPKPSKEKPVKGPEEAVELGEVSTVVHEQPAAQPRLSRVEAMLEIQAALAGPSMIEAPGGPDPKTGPTRADALKLIDSADSVKAAPIAQVVLAPRMTRAEALRQIQQWLPAEDQATIERER